MSKPLYNVVCYGAVQPGKDKKSVLLAMAAMFKTEPKQVLPYFSGKRMVIKSNIDEATTRKYKAAMEKIGLVVKIEKATAQVKNQSQPTSGQGMTQPATSKKTEKENSVQIDTAGITLAEVGADVIENPVEVPPQPIGDISDISMAEPGADIIENPVEVPPQPIGDISDISLAEVGADVIENPVEVPPQPIGDISDISLAEPGADIIKNPKEKKAAPLPDISDLSLE